MGGILHCWVHRWQACSQGLTWVCILSDPCVNKTASNIMFYSVAMEKRVHFKVHNWILDQWTYCQVHSSVDSGPWESCCLVTGCLFWWAQLTLNWPERAGTEPQAYFRFHSQDWGLRTWLWNEEWMCFLPGRWVC